MSNKRAVLKAFGAPYKIEQGAIPERKPGYALVRLTHSGCCFTDTKAHSGEDRQVDMEELVGGHEGIGTIVEVDEGHSSGLVVGQRVGMGFLSSTCGECEVCAHARPSRLMLSDVLVKRRGILSESDTDRVFVRWNLSA